MNSKTQSLTGATPAPLKTYRVEIRTQFETCTQRTREWSAFNTYRARSKADAVKAARRENDHGGCFDGRTHGLIWWRAIEVEDSSDAMARGLERDFHWGNRA
jgi:hypothetical protein